MQFRFFSCCFENFMNLFHVFFLHWSNLSFNFKFSIRVEFIFLYKLCHRGILRKFSKTTFSQFLCIQISVHVNSCCNWFWEYNSSSINCLPNIFKVNSSCYFLNEKRSKTFRSQFFMNAKEINLSCFQFFTFNVDFHWCSRNECC